MLRLAGVFLLCGLCLACLAAEPEEPPALPDSDGTYLAYVTRAPEFQRIPPRDTGRWDTWIYMPWRYRWAVGTGEEGGRFCRDHGINGGMTDHGQGPLDWLRRWNLRFYNDHTAGKGDLWLDPQGLDAALKDPRAVRPRPLDAALLAKLENRIAENLRTVRESPLRVAYALDDEISWGSFMRPAVWRLNSDDAAYQRWLDRYYGGKAPKAQWVTPDAVLPELEKPLREIDLSPLLDRMSWNDSVWTGFLGRLVERCNREDPATPCGIVGAQAPGLWGGYDYAKLAKKVQFIEAYDIGSTQAILRSFDRENKVPRVTTHFRDDARGTGNDVWLAWHYFAHGNRGMIGWVGDEWFENGKPRPWPNPWIHRFGKTLRELGEVQGPKMAGARFLHDGVALYYSHPSIQVSWVLDSEAHGKTWMNRNDDFRLGTSYNVRKAWELMLADAGLRYDFLAYDEVVRRGVPSEYRVLILPAVYALSDIEARRIADFARAGGTVIADFACGLFDPHGRGRSRGALDDLFGIERDGDLSQADFFSGRLWVETDQEEGYSYKRYRELFETLRPRLHQGYAIAEKGLPVGQGKSRAVHLNLSPQRYLMDRQEGTADAERRRPFLEPVAKAGATPWITARSLGKSVPLEVTAWSKGDRTLVFVLQNVLISGRSTGGGGAEGLAATKIPIEVRLAGPVAGARDERTGKPLPDGDRFTFELDTTEAVFWSFRGMPPAKSRPSESP